jgi:uncharacterized membrane protein YedE/YeeE
MLNDHQRLVLSHALLGFIFGAMVAFLRLWKWNLFILLFTLLLSGHVSQRLLRVRSYRIGGFLGWLLSGALTFMIWYLYGELIIYSMLT